MMTLQNFLKDQGVKKKKKPVEHKSRTSILDFKKKEIVNCNGNRPLVIALNSASAEFEGKKQAPSMHKDTRVKVDQGLVDNIVKNMRSRCVQSQHMTIE